MPARIPGTTKDSQPFALAIPQAVVGPPILAFDAKSNSFNQAGTSFLIQEPPQDGWLLELVSNMKILGAVLMTFHMLPLAPTTTKNTCEISLFKYHTIVITFPLILLNFCY